MTAPTREQIEEAIKKITGDPTTGPVKDITPELSRGLYELFHTGDGKEARIVKAPETRTTSK